MLFVVWPKVLYVMFKVENMAGRTLKCVYDVVTHISAMFLSQQLADFGC